MNTFFEAALRSLPSVASSPYAMAAYFCAVIAYVVLGWRVTRNRNLLANIEKLPAADRAKILRAEMDVVVPDSISAEDWLRVRIHRYYFVGFIIACLTAVAIAALVFLNVTGRLRISADVYTGAPLHDSVKEIIAAKTADTTRTADAKTSIQPGDRPGIQSVETTRTADVKTSIQPGDRLGIQSMTRLSELGIRFDTRLSYEYDPSSPEPSIIPRMPYLDAMKSGNYVNGLRFWYTPFEWEFPIISIKVENNSRDVVLLKELRVYVRRSDVDIDPVLVAKNAGYNATVPIYNEGWGKAIEPTTKFSIEPRDRCEGSLSSPAGLLYTFSTASIDDFGVVPIGDKVPQDLARAVTKCDSEIESLCVAGYCSSGSLHLTCRDSDSTSPICSNPSSAGLSRDIKELQDELAETYKALTANEREKERAQLAADLSAPSNRQGELDIARRDLLSYLTTGVIPPVRYMRSCFSEPVCVRGEMSYKNERREARTFRFKTLVYLGGEGVGAPAPPSYQYDIYLEAGKSDYELKHAISQEIKPGSTDHFLVRIATNKSARFELSMALDSVSKPAVWKGDLVLTTFVPRSGAKLAGLEPATSR